MPNLHCYTVGHVFGEIRPAKPTRRWMDEFPGRHPYRCLPLAIGNAFGWEILCPFDIEIEYNGGPDNEDMKIRAADGREDISHLALANFTRGILTLHTGYQFHTEPGWRLLATGPFNYPRDGMSPLTGVIETDWLPYPFTMNWQLTRPGVFTFTKGEPYCHILPVPANFLNDFDLQIYCLEDNPPLLKEQLAFADSRTEFMAQVAEGDAEAIKQAWQRFYFRGELPTGSKAPEDVHVSKLRLNSPVDLRGETPPPITDPAPKSVTKKKAQAKPAKSETTTISVEDIGKYRAITNADHADFVYMEEFLNQEQCQTLLDAAERNRHRANYVREQGIESRTLSSKALPASERTALSIMQQARLIAAQAVGTWFGIEGSLCDTGLRIVQRSATSFSPGWSREPSGEPGKSPEWLFAGLIFLNQGYEGGQTYLLEEKIRIPAKSGLFIAFEGDRYKNLVMSPVTSGEMLILPINFTNDAEYIDELAALIY